MILKEIDNLIIESTAIDIGKGFVRSLNPLTKARHTTGELIDRSAKYLGKMTSHSAVNPTRNKELFRRVTNQSIGSTAGKALMGLGGLGAISIGANAALKGAYDKYNPLSKLQNANSPSPVPVSQIISKTVPKLIKT